MKFKLEGEKNEDGVKNALKYDRTKNITNFNLE